MAKQHLTASTASGSFPDISMQTRIATKQWEKRAIYRLRYEVNVQELAKPLGSIVNKKRQIQDPLDEQSILVYIQAGDEIIATERLTIASAKDFPAEITETFHFHKFQSLLHDPGKAGLCLSTKLVVKMEYRNSAALYLLLAEAYRIVRENNVQFAFTGCNPHLIPLYEQMGFRRYTRNFSGGGYGLLVPMVLVLEDSDHFRQVRSPFHRLVRKYDNDVTIAQRFSATFPHATASPNSRLISRDSLWEYAGQYLSRSPLEAVRILRDLDQTAASDLIGAGACFSCTGGDHLLVEGSIDNNLYILLKGSLLSKSEANSLLLPPGSHFGGLGLAEQTPYPASVSAATDCELIVIPRPGFEKYRHQHPEAAATILAALAGGEAQNTCKTITIGRNRP